MFNTRRVICHTNDVAAGQQAVEEVKLSSDIMKQEEGAGPLEGFNYRKETYKEPLRGVQ